jgi:hypothetical protein
MGAHKLDIEFEDEDEVRREAELRAKREKELAKAVDLEFAVEDSTGEINVDVAAIKQKKSAQSVSAPQPAAARPVTKPNVAPAPRPSQPAPSREVQPVDLTFENYTLGDGLNAVMAQNELLKAEMQAKIQMTSIQVKAETLINCSQEAKLLEYKINQILSQVNAKAPAVKNELLNIKKLLADYVAAQKSLDDPSKKKAS